MENEEPALYSFFVDEQEITNTLQQDLIDAKGDNEFFNEQVIRMVYQPQAVFRVRAVTRCSSTLEGHAEPVLSVQFSPNGRQLASGSGDCTVRFWDLNTQTPKFTGTGHQNWVLCIAWSPNANYVASGSMDNTVRLWNGKSGQSFGNPLKGHTKWITSIAWEPMHKNSSCSRLASSSKDGTVRVWDILRGQLLFVLSQHTDAVQCVKWGGEGWIYSASRDRTIRVWDAIDGRLVKVLQGHAHWVNSLTLSTEFILRTGPFDHTDKIFETENQAFERSVERYKEANTDGEYLVSGSDDFTLFLWKPSQSNKFIARLTGHQALVNHVSFSPDGRVIASGSFDKSIKLWSGTSGKMLISASKDSTLKIWDMRTKKVKIELPGHLDEVYAVDWSPGGDQVASGGKDKVLKL